MFVSSLSWRKDRGVSIKRGTKRRFSHTGSIRRQLATVDVISSSGASSSAASPATVRMHIRLGQLDASSFPKPLAANGLPSIEYTAEKSTSGSELPAKGASAKEPNHSRELRRCQHTAR